MSRHDKHSHCEHVLKFCEKCDVPYCSKCNFEWAKPCNLPHYQHWLRYDTTTWPRLDTVTSTLESTSMGHNHSQAVSGA